jgi:peptidyl-prolyl cis-trans isomerase D
VKRIVSQRAAEKLAVSAASEKYAALEKDPKNTAGFTSAAWVSRNKPGKLFGPALDKVMSINTDQFPALVSVNIPGQGATIYRIDEIRQPTNIDPKVQQAQAQQIQALAAQGEFAGFMGFWRNDAGVKVINPLQAPSSANSGS